MSLTSITVVASNNPYSCCVDFVSSANVSALGNIAAVEIYRQKYGILGIGNKILNKIVSSVSDLDFQFSDLTNKSEAKYVYTVQLVTSDSTLIEYSEFVIDSTFIGLFVGDYEKQYVAQYNCKTNYSQKTQSNYVTTLASRTPYKVSNANLNYADGNSSGMFLPFDNNYNPLPDYTGEYSEEVIAFLSDGKEKILKTSRGEIWLVTIDEDISVDSNDNYMGTRIISFDWTEIGDVPVLRTV